MPHVTLKHHPRSMTPEERASLIDDLQDVLRRHLQAKENAISITLKQVSPEDWNEQVVEAELNANSESVEVWPRYGK